MEMSFYSMGKFPSTPHRSRNQPQRTTPRASSSSSSSEKVEIRVCTEKSCRKQGSLDVWQVLTGIAPPNVTVNSCGCLAKCGAGPNIVILPGAVFVKHCGTPRKAADVMSYVCDVGDDEVESRGRMCLEALALRKRAEDEMGRGDFSLAHSLLSEAIDLKPFGGVHIIYMKRSAVRLALNNTAGALEDAKEVLTLAPRLSEAYICEGDVYMAMDKFEAAEESYSIALELEPTLRRVKSFKARITKLQDKLTPSNLG